MSTQSAAGNRRGPFSWSKVPSPLQKAIVERLLGEHREVLDDEIDPNLTPLSTVLERALGRPPLPQHNPFLAPILQELWLPRATDRALTRLVAEVHSSLPVISRGPRPTTRSAQIALLQSQRRTALFRKRLRAAFVSDYRTPATTAAPTKTPKGEPPRAFFLTGEGTPRTREPYETSIRAIRALNEQFSGKDRSGSLVILPTGAGKTDVALEWVISRMEAEPDTRLLWVAGQQELVEQAAARAIEVARHRPKGFRAQVRVVHSLASRLASILDPDCDAVFATVQTLAGHNPQKKLDVVRRFASRPLVVIVDEVHHAGAATYLRTIDALTDTGNVAALIGLSATPYPNSPTAQQEVERRFRRTAIRVSRESLIADGVLAKPVRHEVETHETITLDSREKRLSESDLTASVLGRVGSDRRNRLVVRSWQEQRRTWGKTLVFATNIENAEALGSLFREHTDDVRVLHSRSEAGRRETLDWFRQTRGEPVLVSVGMLTEGVDLPDARTAFLARPTSSYILLNQMMGRVLRGPRAGGDPEAHVVYFRDSWTNFDDVVGPDALSEIEGPPRPPPPPPPPPEDVPQEVVDALIDALLTGDETGNENGDLPGEDLPDVGLEFAVVELVGYYACESGPVPVFAHTEEALGEYVEAAASRGGTVDEEPFFVDCRPPLPTPPMLDALDDEVARTGKPPRFVPIVSQLGPVTTAREILAAGALSDEQRMEMIREDYEETPAGAGYQSLWAYEDAVNRALRDLRSRKVAPDGPIPSGSPDQPLLPRAERDLAPLWERVTAFAGATLGGTEEIDRLANPEVSWTTRVVESYYGIYNPSPDGNRPDRIRINSLLRAPADVISDDLIEFVLWHELMHHLLPGHGHDSRFYELETKWPRWAELDAELDTLHERWNTDPAAYR